MKFSLKGILIIPVLFSLLFLVSCSSGYDRENFIFSNYMDDNGDDIAEYLHDKWDIDSAFVMHMGFFKAKDWKTIFPEEMQTIFVGDERYSESEYLEEKGYDVNAPLFIVYFSKLSKVEGNSYDDAGVNAGSLATEYSETGIDAAHDNYESANYNYEDRLYYMAYATIVDGEFKLLMCCDADNFNDEVAFGDYYSLIGKNDSFYSYSIGGLVQEWKHKKAGYDVYEIARTDFKKFLKKQKIAVFAPTKKRKDKSSDFELEYKGFKSSSLKSLDYFFMIYNGAAIKAAEEKKLAKDNNKVFSEINKVLKLVDTYWSTYESQFGSTEGSQIRDKIYGNATTSEELQSLLKESKKIEKSLLIADGLSKKIELLSVDVKPNENYKLDAFNDLRQSLNRGYSIDDLQNCKEESLEQYTARLKELEVKFDEKFKQRVAYHK
jgi:hypothetical protein